MTAFSEEIMDGPSKFNLMLALFDWSPTRIVTFIGKAGQKFEVSITELSLGDASGESWNIRGSVNISANGERVQRVFIAAFRTDNRKGTIAVQEKGYGRR